MMFRAIFVGYGAICLLTLVGQGSAAETRPAESLTTPGQTTAESTAQPSADEEGSASAAEQVLPADPEWIRLSPTEEIWIDRKNKRLIVGGRICLRRGLLEMFACPRGTKEHESIVSVNAKAYLVHTGLLALGAQPGRPVQYDPKYVPATGPKVRVDVAWQNTKGSTELRPAQQMILHVKTRKPMEHGWVFAGSGFWQDEPSGERYYLAENGELICVSNFSSALLDLPIESPRDNAQLLFEANTDQIPPLGTAVQLILTPEIPAAKAVPPVKTP